MWDEYDVGHNVIDLDLVLPSFLLFMTHMGMKMV